MSKSGVVQLRTAHKNDIDILFEFERALIKFEREFNQDFEDTQFHYYDILELIDSPKSEVIVAIVDDEIVGSGYAKLKEPKSYMKHELYGHLGFMYVKPKFRRLGINQKIIVNLIEWVKGQGVNDVMLQVYAENTAAVNAYRKNGFEPNLLEMKRKI